MVDNMIGANLVDLGELAETFGSVANCFDPIRAEVNQRLGSAPWTGPDADRFRSDWSRQHSPSIAAAESALRAASQTIRQNLNEQATASGVDAAGLAMVGAIAAVTGAAAGGVGWNSGRRGSPGGSVVAPPESLKKIKRWLDTGGLGVTHSDLSKIQTELAHLSPAEKAAVLNALTDSERSVLRDQMQESRGKGGMTAKEQGAFLRMLSDSPEALRRFLGDDMPTREFDGEYQASRSREQLAAKLYHDSAPPGQIKIVRLDNGNAIVYLPGIEDGDDPLNWEAKGVNDTPRDEHWARESHQAVGHSNPSADWSNPYAVSVRLALQDAGVPAGSHVVLVGHSQGAYTAMELAADKSFNHFGCGDGYSVQVDSVISAEAATRARIHEMPAHTSGLVVNNTMDPVATGENFDKVQDVPLHYVDGRRDWAESSFTEGLGVDAHNERHNANYFSGGGGVPSAFDQYTGSGREYNYRVHDLYR